MLSHRGLGGITAGGRVDCRPAPAFAQFCPAIIIRVCVNAEAYRGHGSSRSGGYRFDVCMYFVRTSISMYMGDPPRGIYGASHAEEEHWLALVIRAVSTEVNSPAHSGGWHWGLVGYVVLTPGIQLARGEEAFAGSSPVQSCGRGGEGGVSGYLCAGLCVFRVRAH